MIQIHLAGCEQFITTVPCLSFSGYPYSLMTAFPFICECMGMKRAIYHKKQVACDLNLAAKCLSDASEHCILDSGLFTLMFGSEKRTIGSREIGVWFDNLCEFIDRFVPAKNFSVVEVDCQKVTSPTDAWKLREKMRERLPKHEIMNVWHLEDGMDGLLKLVDFSNYICLSIPEYRIHIKRSLLKQFIDQTVSLILKRKPKIKIHLLGCTSIPLIRGLESKVTSCDSSAWNYPLRICGSDFDRSLRVARDSGWLYQTFQPLVTSHYRWMFRDEISRPVITDIGSRTLCMLEAYRQYSSQLQISYKGVKSCIS